MKVTAVLLSALVFCGCKPKTQTVVEWYFRTNRAAEKRPWAVVDETQYTPGDTNGVRERYLQLEDGTKIPLPQPVPKGGHGAVTTKQNSGGEG